MIFSGPSACCASADYSVTWIIIGGVLLVLAILFAVDSHTRCR